MRPAVWLIATALTVAAMPDVLAQTRQSQPPPAAGQACVRVVNTTEYWYPIHIRVPGKSDAAVFRIDAGEFRRFCVTIALTASDRIEVELRSWMAPIGECRLPPGGQAEIVRTKDQDGDPVTRLGCNPK